MNTKENKTTLDQLYQSMETFRSMDISTDELEKKVAEKEEEIIKNEILPLLTEKIEPALSPVKRNLVLVVDYVPGEPLSVRLSRKRNFSISIPDAKELTTPPMSTSGPINSPITRARSGDFVVSFPDGKVIANNIAADTFEEVIRIIGIERVRKVAEEHNIRINKVPLISRHKHESYNQKELGGGLYLITHCNNNNKKRILTRLSSLLNLGLEVEIID
ncbi:hypothetical protein [Porphyromonas somerae]|uniref:hypothetical protein n=1 Tax=Porphyromonas somerae TaxID=322095 RepID=UPI002A83C17E|nr:hypothetical protein [Porphyromonas somerae]MDY3885450.1 hypothetical protein [Porphyromonas somerae]